MSSCVLGVSNTDTIHVTHPTESNNMTHNKLSSQPGSATMTTIPLLLVLLLVVILLPVVALLYKNDKVEIAAIIGPIATTAIVIRTATTTTKFRPPPFPESLPVPPVVAVAIHPTTRTKCILLPSTKKYLPPQQHRRSFIETAASCCTILPWMMTVIPTSVAAATETKNHMEMSDHDNDTIVRITLTDPSMKLGLQLSNRRMDDESSLLSSSLSTTEKKNTATGTTIVYVERIIASPSSIRNVNIQEGMILLHYDNAKAVQEVLSQADSYPITLYFQTPPNPPSPITLPSNKNDNTYQIVKISSTCSSSSSSSIDIHDTTLHGNTNADPVSVPLRRSQRGDVLGIIYEARLDSPTGRIYDASDQRGTGPSQLYQMVLGSGDMLIGVDQGLYDMCLNDIRGIYIPSRLAYSTRGNRMFQIPPNTNLYWQVQLVRIE